MFLWVCAIATFLLGSFALLVIGGSIGAALPDNWGFRGYWILTAAAFAVPGVIVASRRPGHVIGRVLLLGGLANAASGALQEYATYGLLLHPGALPAPEAVAWLNSWVWLSFMGVLIALLLLFPDGALPSRRWRPLAWVAGAFLVAAAFVLAFRPGPLENFAALDNPAALGRTAEEVRHALEAIVLGPSMVAVLGAVALAPVTRYRRATRERRQQLKWFASAGAVFALAFAYLIAFGVKAGQIATLVAFTSVPIAVGIAVLRYRLYEIDTIIDRAIVYGSLTAILAGVFAASTEILKRVFVAFTGGGSDLAIVVALFLIGTLFAPLRSRLQQVVDKRVRPSSAAHRAAGAPPELVPQLIRELAQLHADGILDDAEYGAKKAELLARL